MLNLYYSPHEIIKELKDFRSSIATLPGSSTNRVDTVKLQKSPKAPKLYRNLLTSYENLKEGVYYNSYDFIIIESNKTQGKISKTNYKRISRRS